MIYLAKFTELRLYKTYRNGTKREDLNKTVVVSGWLKMIVSFSVLYSIQGWDVSTGQYLPFGYIVLIILLKNPVWKQFFIEIIINAS